MNEEKAVVCTGRTAAPLIMGVMFWLIGIGVTFLLLISGTSQEVKGAGIIFFYYAEWRETIFCCFGVTKELR